MHKKNMLIDTTLKQCGFTSEIKSGGRKGSVCMFVCVCVWGGGGGGIYGHSITNDVQNRVVS
jgi:hypothetical protein